MKRGVSRASVLLLVLAALFVLLTCRSLSLRGLGLAIFSDYYYQSVYSPGDPEVNATIFSISAVDDSFSDLKAQVNALLNGRIEYTGSGRFRFVSVWPGNSYRKSFPATRIRLPSGKPQPEPRELFRRFRQLLEDWFAARQQFQPSVMSELSETLKSSSVYTPNQSNQTQTQTKCAVVGNSGILLNADHGDRIDAHDVVIRLNNARTQGYERHVGSKTTISFINGNVLHTCALRDGCTCHPYGPRVPVVFYACQPAQMLEYLVCSSSHAAPLAMTDARFDALCARLVKHYSVASFVKGTGNHPTMWGKFHDRQMFHYSSGMQAVMLAVGLCDEVGVFGFGKGSNAKHHYHTSQKSELDLHDYEAEYLLYRDLADRPEEIPFLKEAGIKIPPVVFYH